MNGMLGLPLYTYSNSFDQTSFVFVFLKGVAVLKRHVSFLYKRVEI